MPISPDKLIKAVRYQLNVAQISGRVTANEFNIAVDLVVTSLFNDLLKQMEKDQEVSDDLRPFVVTLGSGTLPPLTVTDGQAEVPADYERLVVSSRKYAKPSAGCGSKPVIKSAIVTFYATSKYYWRISNALFKPTEKRPIFTHENQVFSVYPPSINSMSLSYIRKPAIPFFDFIIDNGAQVYLPPGQIHNGSNPTAASGTPSRSVESDFLESMEPELVNRLVRLMSIPKEAQLQIQTAGRNKA
jgi:hypothetical protein